ncbi:MAG TPA: FecR domain-containing protein [Terriglobales bacterium]|nr:FecR domain-containing protein [Terriglobales bacterium]
MSDPRETDQMGGAEILRIQAADWLMQQRTADAWTEADQVRLDAWLAESPAHLLAYWRLEAAWSRTDRLAALRLSTKTEAPSSRPRNIFPFLARTVAALVGVGIVGLIFLRQPAEPQGREFATSVGGHETIRMADGSLVELNTDTTAHVLDRGDMRKVTLNKGEAYFQVVHNQAKPFVVVVGNRKIVDLGTKFLVRQDASKLQVTVFEGLIRFEPGKSQGAPDGKPVSLSAGETLVATARNFSITKATPPDVTEALGWRRGLLVFYRKPLADAASEFNRYNNEQIVIVGDDLGHLPITGTLAATDPDQFIRMAKNLFGLHVEHTDGKILISR